MRLLVVALSLSGCLGNLFDNHVVREKLLPRSSHDSRRVEQVADDDALGQDVTAYCERTALDASSVNETCTCNAFDDGVVELSCLDNCLYCGDTASSSCGQLSIATNLTDGISNNFQSYASRFQYDGTGGRYESISVEEYDCDDFGGCDSCRVFVNGTQCNSCSRCLDGSVTIDCENVVEGSSIDDCWTEAPPGLFEAFGYDAVQCAVPPPPSNDNCSSATPIVPGDVVTGNLTGALEETVPVCNTETGTHGVWYSFAGTGTPVVLSTCSGANIYGETSLVSVYQGSGCDFLECAVGSYQSTSCSGYYSGGSSVLLPTDANTTYHVYVAGYFGSFGTFDLSVTGYAEEGNNECISSKQISADWSPVIGTVEFGPRGGLAVCDTERVENYGVSWYQFVASQDGIFRASTCNSGTIGWSMANIAITSGDCDTLSCVEQSELYSYYDTCSDGGTFVDFQAVTGASYEVAVWGSGYGDVAVVELDIRPLSPPSNDNCEDAISIDLNANFTATFSDVSLSDGEKGGSCFEQVGPSLGGGIWYSFVGTGDIVIATTCSNEFYPYLAIQTGSCGALQCASPATFNFASTCSIFTYGQQSPPLETEEGTVYYILVSGSGPISGSFEFSLRTVAPVENDSCLDAIEIEADGKVIIGSTEGAIFDEFNDNCAYSSRSPGVWYTVVGKGNMLTADTCSEVTNFDTVISVYRGNCGELQCVGANDDGCQSLSSSFTWDTEEYETYYIRVSGFGDGQAGDYGFKVTPFVPAVNDVCNGAINIPFGEPLSGTMEGASSYNESYSCYSGYQSPTLWYYIDGTGTPLKVSTCSPNSTLFGGIQAFEGTTCSNLECVGLTYEGGGYSDSDCSYPSAATWFLSEVGMRYYILLIDSSTGGANSTFILNVTEFEVAANDVCETALPIAVSETVEGSTTNALPDNVTCDLYYSSDVPGVWYSAVGTGNVLMASTCSSSLSFDSSIYVFAGGCDAFECVAVSQSVYSCGDSFYSGSRASFRSEVGVQYYILVTGAYSSAVGDFGLSLSDTTPPPNDLCSDAIQITPNDGVIEGSVSNATSFFGANYTCAYDSSAVSVWYSVIGTGDVLAISTCSSQLTFDSGISVSTGSCDDHVCVTSNAYRYACSETPYGAARVTIQTEIGVEYFIAVEGLNSPSQGDFGLTVSTLQVPGNDECPGAIPIQADAGSVTGSITNATGIYDYNTTSCGYSYDAPDVWYSMIGTGEVYAVSTCSSVLNFNASVSISKGSCDLQECVVYGTIGYDDCTESAYGASRVVFRTEVGVEYFIAVQAVDYASEGEFTLEFSTVETPVNDECSGAVVIQPDNTTIMGSLVNATGTVGVNSSCDYSYGAPGVWFSMIGTGDVYSISTCSSELTFDSALIVATGSCDNQTCITSGAYNDYECIDSSFSAAKVIVHTEVGVEYYIQVQSLSSSADGEFALRLTTVVAPENDVCTDAISIPVGAETVSGSITNATGPPIFSSSCSYSYDAPDVWYTLIGTGDAYAVTTCSSVLNFQSALSVSSGSCSNQQCITTGAYNDETCQNGIGSAARVLFRTDVGVEYFISVEGIDYSSSGDFELQLSTVAVPPNDECSGAVTIVPNGEPVFGSTSIATYFGTNSSCSGSDTSPDLWYRVQGNGTVLTASTCGARTNYDSQISIFEGDAESCDSTCIVTNDDFCNGASQVSWLADAGVTYFIRVHGYSTSSGMFVLRVTSA